MAAMAANEEKLKSENSKIKNRVVLYGIVSIVVMILSTYLQVTFLKNFFRNKKIIWLSFDEGGAVFKNWL